LLAGCGSAEPSERPPGGAAGYPRTGGHLGGELRLDAPPTRIALTSNRYVLDELLVLDAVPVAYAASESEQLPIWTREALALRGATIENYNGLPYPNPPTSSAWPRWLAPDLIVGFDSEDAAQLETLRGIAPVVQVAYTDLDGSRLRMLAEILGREDRVPRIQADVAAALATVTPLPGELAVAFGYVEGGAAAQVYNGGGRIELIVLERAGFTVADYGRPAGERDFTVTEENLALLDRAALWNVAPYPGDRSAEQFESSPVLQNPAVVREGRYRSLDSDQSQAILFWTPLAVPFLVETLNELVASYDRPGSWPAAMRWS
jgi:ABC-type Fe3+-hydroxamate transport system substrate-binding protein